MFRAMFDVKVLVLVVNLKQNEVNKKQEQKDSSTPSTLVLPFLFAEVGVGGTTK